MDNPETEARLGTIHRSKTNKTQKHRKLKRRAPRKGRF